MNDARGQEISFDSVIYTVARPCNDASITERYPAACAFVHPALDDTTTPLSRQPCLSEAQYWLPAAPHRTDS